MTGATATAGQNQRKYVIGAGAGSTT